MGIPELKPAAPALVPVLVGVEDQVAAASPRRLLAMHREVGMDVEEAARPRLVHAAAFDLGIGERALDAGQAADEPEKTRRIHLPDSPISFVPVHLMPAWPWPDAGTAVALLPAPPWPCCRHHRDLDADTAGSP